MDSVQGDIVRPTNFILPVISGALTSPPVGFMCISGADISWYNGAVFKVITST